LGRGLSMIDAFAVGMMNQGITPTIWTMITWGLGTHLTGNLLWASLISLVLVGFGFPLVWGITHHRGALASLVYLGILFYFLIFTSEMRAAPARRTWSAGPIAGRRGCAVVLRLNGRNRLRDGTSAGSPSDAERCRIRHRAKFVDYRILPRAPGS